MGKGDKKLESFDGLKNVDIKTVVPKITKTPIFEHKNKFTKWGQKVLKDSKKEILKNLDISPKHKKIKEDTSKNLLDNSLSKLKPYLDMLNEMLKKAFDDKTKSDYSKWYNHLTNMEKDYFGDWFYNVTVSSANSKWITVSIAKYWKETIKEFIPESKLLKNKLSEKNWYLRWDEIVVYISKNEDGSLSLTETDPKLLKLNKLNSAKKILYMPKHAEKPYEGKIIGVGEDIDRKEVVFLTDGGTKFSIWVDNFLEGVERAKPAKEQSRDKLIKAA